MEEHPLSLAIVGTSAGAFVGAFLASGRLGEGCDVVLVVAPAPEGMPGMPGVDQDVAHLRGTGSQVIVMVPDLPSKQAIGDNPFDPARRAAVAEAGRKQGQLESADVAAAWC